ncbi:hypothetical protein C1646_758231 [Rhizophagus diaphanus]|nr:hypothetical protein C1646_758231 [Rhizophagus diaphanus] [Rhizophagus sp. MUCL 43196]
MSECRLFYQLQYDNSIYHVICKIHLQGSENTILLDDDEYEFFFENLNDSVTTTFHVTCKLLSHSLIVKILNKKIYGIDFNVTYSKSKITLHQKLSLKLTLQQILPSYFSHISDNEVRPNSDEYFNSSLEEIESNIMTTYSTSSSIIDSQNMQSHLSTESLESNELRLFYQAPDDDNIYHVTCKMFLQDLEITASPDDVYDYEFISNDSEMILYVTCKLLPCSLIVNILNKETYGIDFDISELKRKCLLSSHQKCNLEKNLKKILHLYFLQHTSETGLYFSENLSTSHESINDNIVNNHDNVCPHN